ncbi:hypothetical protein RHGRI_024991 [Rhododendron griersonianum]|uniref:Uncharacterized protein n=1 Tax=Rhododendron griersonianum TaxID=479676 RepID=A0AAV6JDR1_9ERIC|nr:hypothetical protein RHGRI_024991 [Rhododendron griersonianum]
MITNEKIKGRISLLMIFKFTVAKNIFSNFRTSLFTFRCRTSFLSFTIGWLLMPLWWDPCTSVVFSSIFVEHNAKLPIQYFPRYEVMEASYFPWSTCTNYEVSLQSKRTRLSFSEANIVISIADQMGGNQVTEEVDPPKPSKPVGSMALTCFEDKNLSVGNPWSTGLFDCHENQTNAIVTACLTCITFGQIAEIVDGGEMTCPLGTFFYMLMMLPLCSQWIMGSKYRAKLRKKYGWNGVLAQQQGGKYQDQEFPSPPLKQIKEYK